MPGEGDLLKKFGKVIDEISEDKKQERKQREEERRALLVEIGQEVKDILQPALEEIASRSKITSEDLKDALSGITVEAPIVDIPPISVPQPKVTVNVPEIKIPEIEIPDIEVPAAVVNFPDEMNVRLSNINLRNPLPVILTDNAGKPYVAGSMGPTNMMVGGGGGAKGNGIAYGVDGTVQRALLVDEGGRLQVDIISQPSLAISQTSGAADSVNVIQFGGVDVALNSGVTNSGTLRVVNVTDVATSVNVTSFTSSVAVSVQTDSGQSAMDETNDAVRVSVVAGSLTANTEYNDEASPDQAGGKGILNMVFDGGSVQSWTGTTFGVGAVAVSGFDGSLAAVTLGALDSNLKYLNADTVAKGTELGAGVLRTYLVADQAYSVRAIANSGVDIGDVDILSIAAGDNNIGNVDILSIAAGDNNIGNVDVLSISAGDNNIGNVDIVTIPTVEIKQVSGAVDSTNVIQLGGVAIDLGSGTVGGGTQRMVIGSDSTVMVVGDVVSDAADSALGPVKIGGIARTANPTAVAAGDRVSATYDDVGRQVMRPVQIRDLMTTARVSLTTGTETTLLAGAASTFHDLIWITASNNSSASVTLDVRDATTGGIVLTLDIPANGVVGVAGPVPYPQNEAANAWTVDMPDITGTTVAVSALFTKEV